MPLYIIELALLLLKLDLQPLTGGKHMNRAALTEKLLDIKREKGWTWKHICAEIGGMSPVMVTGGVLGQQKMTKPMAGAGATPVRLSEDEGGRAHPVAVG